MLERPSALGSRDERAPSSPPSLLDRLRGEPSGDHKGSCGDHPPNHACLVDIRLEIEVQERERTFTRSDLDFGVGGGT